MRLLEYFTNRCFVHDMGKGAYHTKEVDSGKALSTIINLFILALPEEIHEAI